jgi:hypothetical protein
LTGTPQAERAAEYLARQLRDLGVSPLPGESDYLLPFEFTAGMDDDGSMLGLDTTEGGEKVEWSGVETIQALSFSDTAVVSGPVIFAGYGLTIPESQDFGYDSYVGLDVKDKIVVMLRYFPEDVDQETRVKLARYAGLRYKAMRARELGAAGILVLTGPRSPNAGLTVPMTFDTALSGSGIAAASIAAEVGQTIFEHVDEPLEEIQASLDTGNPHVVGFDLPGITLTLDARVVRERRTAHNVVGYLPSTHDEANGDPEYVALGAHYDHLGHGGHGNSLANKDEAGEIHLGADDNASGVAAVLGVAQKLAQAERSRPVLIGFWTGEELGLLGSSDFVGQERIPTDRIAAYVNFDMVGRMKDNRLSLQATGSSPLWPRVIEQTNVAAGFDVEVQEDPYLPTDSSTFYQAGVPTINFFTGSHEDYHRPTDTAERLNYEDLDRVVAFATTLADRLMELEERPEYQTVARTDSGGSRDALRAFTGTIPDYTTEVEGLLLSGVIEGGPADEAGLQGGDVITEFGGQMIANIYDYTYALDAVKIDVPVTVVFQRDGESHQTEMVPRSRR